ncbi:MAG: F0F1 ATP synthase subunit B [Actinomycetales bacterium]
MVTGISVLARGSLAAAGEDAPNPLLPHLAEVVVGGIAFILLLVVLQRFVMPRFEAVFAERREAIQGGMERAERAQAEAQAALEDYRKQLSDARGEANRIREEAREQGAAIVAEMRQQAQAEAARITTAAHEQVEAERARVLAALRAELGGLAVELASRIVGESLEDEARQRRVVDRFLDDLDANAGSQEREQAGTGV